MIGSAKREVLRLPRISCVLLAIVLSACGGGGGGGSSLSTTVGSIRGVITPSLDSAVDTDTNDTSSLTVFVRNNTLDTAQRIGNPSTVGGYAAMQNTGPLGRLNSVNNAQDIDDSDDIFQVRLAANQPISLTIGDAGTGDLDLYLANSEGVLVDASEGVDNRELVVAPEDGVYYIGVFAYDGYSTYVLQIGDGSAGSLAVESFRYGADFVPGEIILGMETWSQKTGQSIALKAQELGLTERAGAPGRERLLSLPAQARGASRRSGTSRKPVLRPDTEDDKLRTLSAIKALSREAKSAPLSLNYVRHAFAMPSDPYAQYQWHYNMINLPAALDVVNGDAALVAVIDTGVVLDHPDLETQLDAADPDGYDFISNPSNALDGDGIDGNGYDVGDQGPGTGNSSFHGTHVAGTVAAATDNGVGVAGVAGGARIMALRALGKNGTGTSYDILQAVRYASRQSNDSGTVPAKRADVINLSLGGSAFSSVEQSVYNTARAAGSIVVAAAGNDGNADLMYPASYEGVISVSAVTPSGTWASYSQANAAIDVAAPGGDMSLRPEDGVLSTHASDASGSIRSAFGFLEGTSMAAPHVAGVIALMRSANPAVTPDQVMSLLASGAITQDLGAAGFDTSFGYGMIDAARAVQEAQRLAGSNPSSAPPKAVSSPPSIEMSARQSAREFAIGNAGGGSLTISGVSDDASWLTVSDLGGSNFRITINRVGLPDGLYTAQITVASNAEPLIIPVRIEVSATATASNGGTHYVLAIDTQSQEAVAAAEVGAIDGTYAYALQGLPTGTYYVAAGSDADNDGFICSPGEACGIYDNVDSPTIIDVREGDNVADIDFSSTYNASVGAASSSVGTNTNIAIPRLLKSE